MEPLFTINPKLNNKDIVIFGTGMNQKHIFRALLQQNYSVAAFCLKEGERKISERLFNRCVINTNDLLRIYDNPYVIISEAYSERDSEYLKSIGVKNIVIENIVASNQGLYFEE